MSQGALSFFHPAPEVGPQNTPYLSNQVPALRLVHALTNLLRSAERLHILSAYAPEGPFHPQDAIVN